MQAGINISPSGLMNLEAAAAYLGVSVGVMRTLRRLHKLPYCKIGVRLYFRQQDLDTFIQSRMKPAAVQL